MPKRKFQNLKNFRSWSNYRGSLPDDKENVSSKIMVPFFSLTRKIHACSVHLAVILSPPLPLVQRKSGPGFLKLLAQPYHPSELTLALHLHLSLYMLKTRTSKGNMNVMHQLPMHCHWVLSQLNQSRMSMRWAMKMGPRRVMTCQLNHMEVMNMRQQNTSQCQLVYGPEIINKLENTITHLQSMKHNQP